MGSDDRNAQLNEVVAKAYAAIANPEGFVPLLSEMVEADAKLAGFEEATELHFENAFAIFDKMYPLQDTDYSGLTTRREQAVECDLELDANLTVVSCNQRLFPSGSVRIGNGIPEWLLDPVSEKRDRTRLRALVAGKLENPRLFLRLFTSPEDENGRWFRAWPIASEDAAGIALHAVRLRWTDKVGDIFREALGLTKTELALTGHLVRGDSLREFAEQRGRAVGTARNQLKALQRKLAINSQADLLLLYAGFVHSLDTPGDEDAPESYQCGNIFTQADGSTIAWEEFGDPDGQPVLYCHPLEGLFLSSGAQAAARRAKLRIIAPWRPFHGASTGKAHGRGSPREFARRIPAFLDHLGIERVVGMAAQAGMPWLAGLAASCPDRLIAAVGVGAFLPLIGSSDYEFLSKRQRIHFRISRSAPTFAKVHMRAMLASMGTGEFYRFVEDFYGGCPRELRAFQAPETVRGMRRAAAYMLQSGTKGPIDTMLNWSAEWSPLLKDAAVPIELLQGEDDANISPQFARLTAQRFGLPEPRIIADAGSFLLFDQPEPVMEFIAGKFARS